MAEAFEVSTELLNEAAQTPAVRAALAAMARRLLPRAQRIAAQAGAVQFGRALRVDTGTRPGTRAHGGLQRPYARIVADVSPAMDEADAASSLSRRQILRRAASGG
jgi:hypothetical protein